MSICATIFRVNLFYPFFHLHAAKSHCKPPNFFYRQNRIDRLHWKPEHECRNKRERKSDCVSADDIQKKRVFCFAAASNDSASHNHVQNFDWKIRRKNQKQIARNAFHRVVNFVEIYIKSARKAQKCRDDDTAKHRIFYKMP